MKVDPRRPSASRRAFLAGAGAIAAGAGVPGAAAAPPELTVMTRNLYLGVDLFRLLDARSVAEVRRVAGEMLADVERRPFPPRAAAIAAEVAATRPDVVGVQEAARVRTRRPGDGEEETPASAPDVDFLDVLSSALADRGLDYEVAASVTTTDMVVPADVEGRRVDAHIADRDALLVRQGVDVADVATGTYDATFDVPVDEGTVSIERGYCLADVGVDGAAATVAATHLEPADPGARLGQARELVDRLPADGPVVLAADLNEGPGTEAGAYELLAGPLDDAHATLRPDRDGFTCCQDPDLRNDRPKLSRRVDAVLHAGLRPTAIQRVGEAPDDRVAVPVDGETVHLWPSDHAGVVATFEAEQPTTVATSTSVPSPTPSPAEGGDRTTSSRTASPPLSGFGPAVALAAVVYAALARRG